MPTSKKNSKMTRRKTRKISRKIVGGANRPFTDELIKYLKCLKPFLPPDFLRVQSDLTVQSEIVDSNCKKPSSKGGQVISMCEHYVYKAPPPGAQMSIIEGVTGNHLQVDGYTMNLLIQSIINKDEVLKKRVETYLGLEDIENSIFKTLIGRKYKYDYDGVICFSVESFIEAFNKKYLESNEQNELIIKELFIKQILIWIDKMVNTLDLLWDRLQFHHCDPKAAQLFISGNSINDIEESEIIVGDLDRVTFSMEIPYKESSRVVRVCLFPRSGIADIHHPDLKLTETCYGADTNKIIKEYLETEAEPQKKQGFLPNVYSTAYPGTEAEPQKKQGFWPSVFPTASKVLSSTASKVLSRANQIKIPSFAEAMRYISQPNINNNLEVAAFLSSILLLIENTGVKDKLYKELMKKHPKLCRLIDFESLKANGGSFAEKTSHTVACKYVKKSVGSLFSTFVLPSSTFPESSSSNKDHPELPESSDPDAQQN